MPLCWCLMQNKSQAGYEAVLQLIKDHLGLWNFTSVVCDFEDAIINAFKNIFDNVEVQGCLFHASDVRPEKTFCILYMNLHLPSNAT